MDASSAIRKPSPLQIAANRRNAQKSTGPRSTAGKRRAALNALRCGLCPPEIEIQLRLKGEDPREYRKLHRDLIALFQPHDEATRHVLELMMQTWWEKARRIRQWTAASPPNWEDLDARLDGLLRSIVHLLRLRHEWWRHRLFSVLGTTGSPEVVRRKIESRLSIFGAKSGARKYPRTSYKEQRDELVKLAFAQILAEVDPAVLGAIEAGPEGEHGETNPMALISLLSKGYTVKGTKPTQAGHLAPRQSFTARFGRVLEKFKRKGAGTIADSV